jgi:phage terminase large subunit
MTQLDIQLYGAQYDFVTDPRRFSVFIGGIGAGKTIAGAARAISAAAGHIDGLRIQTPNTGMITAPTMNILRDATIPTFRELAGDLVARMTTSEPINALLANGSRVYFRSAHNPELLRGPSISWWWGDEAALYTRQTWHIMIGRLREFGRPGYAWLTTTPKGRNWIYQEFLRRPRHSYAFFKAATRQNPFIDLDYYETLRESYSGDFARQELDGDFVAYEGLIYWEFDRAAHVITPAPPPQDAPSSALSPIPLQVNPTLSPIPLQGEGLGERFTHVVAGVDWGFSSPGVILVLGLTSDGVLTGLREEYARSRRIEEWAQVARQLQDTYAIDSFFCDPSEPAFIAQFQQAGCNAVAANNDVLVGIQMVKNRLAHDRLANRPRLLLTPDFVHTAAEFEQYQWLKNRDGFADKPKKANDHCLDALRYACVGVDSQEDGAGEMFDAGGVMVEGY